jgi:hypothetical protein
MTATWTLRIAATCLWAGALAMARVAVTSPSTFRILICAVLFVWGFAVWRRVGDAIRPLAGTLVAMGALVPVGWINPFRVLESSDAVVTAPGFAWRTIGGALVTSAIAFAGAILLARAWKEIQGQTPEMVRQAKGGRSWRGVAIFVAVGWTVLVVGSTTAFLSAVRLTKVARAPGQQVGRVLPPNKPMKRSANRWADYDGIGE